MIEEDVEAFLEHFGVKGMKWGVRKTRPSNVDSKVARIAKIDKKTSRMNASRIMDGAGIVGYYQSRKIGGNSKRPYTNARVRLILRTGVEAAAAITAVNYGLNRVQGSPQQIAGAKISLAALGAQQGLWPRVNQIHNIGVYKRHTKLIEERRSLTGPTRRRGR